MRIVLPHASRAETLRRVPDSSDRTFSRATGEGDRIGSTDGNRDAEVLNVGTSQFPVTGNSR